MIREGRKNKATIHNTQGNIKCFFRFIKWVLFIIFNENSLRFTSFSLQNHRLVILVVLLHLIENKCELYRIVLNKYGELCVWINIQLVSVLSKEINSSRRTTVLLYRFDGIYFTWFCVNIDKQQILGTKGAKQHVRETVRLILIISVLKLDFDIVYNFFFQWLIFFRCEWWMLMNEAVITHKIRTIGWLVFCWLFFRENY